MRFVKLLREGRGVWGVLHGDVVRTLTEPPFEGVRYDGESLPLSGCRLLAPCEATKIVCIGKNYFDHIHEMKSMLDASNTPDRPTLFLKAPNALNAHLGTVHAPDFVGRLDYEGELAVVMKRRAKDVPEEEALDYVLGYTCLNDITARDVQKADGQWARGKNMDGFAPMGPVVTDEVDPEHLTITTRLNGQVVQQGRTEQLITGVRALISFITASMTLEPGDVIATPRRCGPHATRRYSRGGGFRHRNPMQHHCMRGRRTLRGGLRRFSLSFSWKFAIIDTIFVLGGRTLGLHIRLSQQHGLVGPAHPPYQRRGSSAVHHPARAVPRLCGLATGRSHGQKCRAADPQSHPASGCGGSADDACGQGGLGQAGAGGYALF